MRCRRVTPDKVGIHFDRLQRFCLARRLLDHDARKRLAVTTFAGPDAAKDADATPFFR
jgi:cytochrome c oxidase assembly protein Cox11